MQFNNQDKESNGEQLILVDDEIKLEEKTNNDYIPSGNPVSDDKNFNKDVKNMGQQDTVKGTQENQGFFSNDNIYGVGLEVENLAIDPKPNQNQFFSPYGQSYQNQPMIGQFPQYNQPPQFYGTQVNQFQSQPPLAGGFYGASDAGMILPGIPVQMQDPPVQPQQRNGVPINQNAVNDDHSVRQSLIFRIRKNTKWFTGCNACFTILLVIDLLNKISLYNSEKSSSSDDDDDDKRDGFRDHDDDESDSKEPNNLLRASAVISIIEYIIWFVFIILAIHGLTSNKLHLVRYYIKGLMFCIFLEVLANILIFAGFGESSAVQKVSFVIVFILTVLILYSFIKNAKNLLNDIQAYKDKFGGNPISDPINQNANHNNPNNPYNQNMGQANIHMMNNQQYNYNNGQQMNQNPYMAQRV